MHRFRRQTVSGAAQTSNGASASVTTAVATASGSVDATGSQASSLTSVAVSTQQPSSAPVSSTPPTSVGTTTSPTTTLTTPSTSSSPSASPSSSSFSSTTPHTSSSSAASRPTSSTSTSSSDLSPSTTTQPPTSSSQQETTTTITSAYTTYINGSQILTSTSFPSTIPQLSSPSVSSSSNRTAIIAGSAAGGTAFIIFILSFAFCIRRKRFKRLHFLDAITLKRKQARSRATLFDDEDLDDTELPPVHDTDHDTPWDGTDRALIPERPAPAPPPMAPQRPESGSAFREDVWPPPTEATRLMDPLTNRDDLRIDLGRIVDDVMGPSPARVHFSDQSVSSIHRASAADSDGLHSRTTSNASNAALLEAAGLAPISTVPVRPSPLAQQQETHTASVTHSSADGT